MPWSSGDADRFKAGLSGHQKSRWAEIANSVLQRGGSESEAIRQASGALNKPGAMMQAARRRLRKPKQKSVSLEV